MILGVDIGGTKIAAGLVDANAHVVRRVEVPTRASEGYEASRAQVDLAITQLLTPEVSAIGICAPGPLNPLTGVVLNPPNLPGWRDIPLADQVRERFQRRCAVENDANAAGLAETLFGAARGCREVFYITLSTGIGTGIILDGKIYHGHSGAAAEGGHVSIDYRSEVICECGVRGCIEVLASGTGMVRLARKLRPGYPDSTLTEPISAESIAASARAGDACATRVLTETAEMLAAWLGGIFTLLDPEIVVIGGGVSQIGEPLFTPLRRLTPGLTINPHASRIPIVPARLQRDSGVVGAASVWF